MTEPTQNPNAFASFMSSLRTLVVQWQEISIWIPIAAAAIYAAYTYLPLLDPRVGLDLGNLFGLAYNLLAGILVTLMAWLSKKLYTRDLTDEEEAAQPLYDKIVDRLEWAGWLTLWFLLLVRS